MPVYYPLKATGYEKMVDPRAPALRMDDWISRGVARGKDDCGGSGCSGSTGACGVRGQSVGAKTVINLNQPTGCALVKELEQIKTNTSAAKKLIALLKKQYNCPLAKKG